MLTLEHTETDGQGLTVIIGHTNSDLDCFGSMVLARYLYKDAVLVRSDRIHPVARNLYHLYSYHLGLVRINEIDPKKIARIVIVDTRTRGRIDEYFSNLDDFRGEIIIYDHHDSHDKTIPATNFISLSVGANTTLIGLALMRRGIRPQEDDATIALAGIYADTGNFTHDTVTEEDFHVAAWLRFCGGSIGLVRQFLRPLTDKHQITLFHELLNNLVYQEVQGHSIVFATMLLERQQSGLAAIVEKVHEVENPDVTFVVFGFERENSVLIVGRSLREAAPMDKILAAFGGGGHECAASAYIKGASLQDIAAALQEKLNNELEPAASARDILSGQAHSLLSGWTLREASEFLEKVNATGLAVVESEGGGLVGVLTLRDIQKGRKNNQMHAPVSAYMTRKVDSVALDTGVRIIEKIIKERNVGHLPVLDEGRVVGIITRDKIVEFIRERNRRERVIEENARAILSTYKNPLEDEAGLNEEQGC
jgi:tRNA nucleotidyltransferase (CCA-adding enzyme)